MMTLTDANACEREGGEGEGGKPPDAKKPVSKSWESIFKGKVLTLQGRHRQVSQEAIAPLISITV